MDRLIVKNFGPLKDIDIRLNRVNLFIGENGSGKSVLAKLITILSHPSSDRKLFSDYHIDYLNPSSYIRYTSNDKRYFVEYKGERRTSSVVTHESNFSSIYIPAERTLLSLFNRYITTFITADIPLPKFLLHFSSQYVRAREEIQHLHFLNIEYRLKSGQEYIFYTDKEALLLEHASSGIQSALPLYLTVKYFAQKESSIIIEEPEQNLFPKSQKETIEYIMGALGNTNRLFMMTHSPYVLTALNNLILAHEVKEQKGADTLKGIIDERYCLPFASVSAYSLVDGVSVDIMDREDRIIGINVIDAISDEVSDTFDTLLSKLD